MTLRHILAAEAAPIVSAIDRRAAEAERLRQRQELARMRARRASIGERDAFRGDGRHDRRLDVAAAGGLDRRAAACASGGRRHGVQVEVAGAGRERRGRFGGRGVALARGDRADDQGAGAHGPGHGARRLQKRQRRGGAPGLAARRRETGGPRRTGPRTSTRCRSRGQHLADFAEPDQADAPRLWSWPAPGAAPGRTPSPCISLRAVRSSAERFTVTLLPFTRHVHLHGEESGRMLDLEASAAPSAG